MAGSVDEVSQPGIPPGLELLVGVDPAGIDPEEVVADALTEGLELFDLLAKLFDRLALGRGAVSLAVAEQDQPLGAGPVAEIACVLAGVELGEVSRQTLVVLIAVAVWRKLGLDRCGHGVKDGMGWDGLR